MEKEKKKKEDKRNRLHIFDADLFPFKFYITFEKDLDFVHDQFDCYYTGKPIERNELHKSTISYVRMVRHRHHGYGALINFIKKSHMSPSTVAHECSHAVKCMFEHIEADVNCQEIFEYSLGWLVKSCGLAKAYKESSKFINNNKKSQKR